MIGLGCCARVGKDTLFEILNELKPNKFERIGLADLLKAELEDFCKQKYNISSFTQDYVDKELIRPLFVAHGSIKRILSNGTYWTGLAQYKVDEIISRGKIPVCTDIRYSTFSMDEIFWLKEKNKGVYIQIDRIFEGKKILPANSDELEQSKILEKYADYTLNWETSEDKVYLIREVSSQLEKLLDRIQ